MDAGSATTVSGFPLASPWASSAPAPCCALPTGVPGGTERPRLRQAGRRGPLLTGYLIAGTAIGQRSRVVSFVMATELRRSHRCHREPSRDRALGPFNARVALFVERRSAVHLGAPPRKRTGRPSSIFAPYVGELLRNASSFHGAEEAFANAVLAPGETPQRSSALRSSRRLGQRHPMYGGLGNDILELAPVNVRLLATPLAVRHGPGAVQGLHRSTRPCS
jgi:hypothetical protein